ALEGRQVDHRDGQVQRPLLGGGFDRPGGQGGGSGLESHLVHAGQSIEPGGQALRPQAFPSSSVFAATVRRTASTTASTVIPRSASTRSPAPLAPNSSTLTISPFVPTYRCQPVPVPASTLTRAVTWRGRTDSR